MHDDSGAIGQAALPDLKNVQIAVVGLGYVGLPVAVGFGAEYRTVGFDINISRVEALKAGVDSTLEVPEEELAIARHLTYTTDQADLKFCNVFIVTVPTPVNDARQPDLTPMEKASETIGTVLRRGDVVIYESTVYPGATEEVCAPILERCSGLKVNKDFFLGYSPERINPGDRQHRLSTITKITSGSTPEAAAFVDALYRSIVTAGTHPAPSIRVAEAAKVIENTQRDLNIALINEFALIFDKLGIDTLDVLEAAGTKWNFLPFRPGLVGGHCISVDPYYLTYKAQSIGYYPEIVLAGRRINDGMGRHVATRMIRGMIRNGVNVGTARVLVMGLTFKENCPDLRNTRVIDIIRELRDFGMRVDVHDPWANPNEARDEYGLELVEPKPNAYDSIVVTVGHDQFTRLGATGLRRFGKKPSCFLFDVKGTFSRDDVDERL